MPNVSGFPLSQEVLREVIRDALGIERELHLERSLTGKFNNTWFLEGTGSVPAMVIRVAPPEDRGRMLFYEHGMMRQEPGLHGLLRRCTSLPVPEVFYFKECHEFIHRDVIIMERMAGAPMEWGNDALMRTLGLKLREVHQSILAPSGRYGYLGEHAPMEPEGSWRESFRVMWNALLDDIARCRGTAVEEIDAWRARFDEHATRFGHFDTPASLLHMDVWAENILTDGRGGLTGLIDWDRALWGDPEIEFAVLEYCGISTPAFWRGYGEARPTGGDAGIRRVFYLLYEVLKYTVIRIARQGNRAGAERYLGMARGLFREI
jgi:fructosamine-3-kinase